MRNKKTLIVASVIYAIDQFNIPNIELLQDLGYEVHVACNYQDGGPTSKKSITETILKLEKMGVTIHQIDFERNAFNLIQNYKAYKQLKKILEKNHYSMVHSHTPIGGAIARIAVNEYRKEGLISIYTAHGFHFYNKAPLMNWLIFYPVEKMLSRYTDKLITINKEDYDVAKNKFKCKEIIQIPGVGVDLKKFEQATSNKKREKRKLLEYQEDDFILIYVGELSYRKNQEMLLKSIRTMKDDIPNLKVLLVGTGTLRTHYEEIIKNNKIEKYVELLGYRTDIPTLMTISDVCVSTSRQEGLPVNIIEAMAIGLPIVATKVRGHKDLISTGENGFLVENATEFQNKIAFLYKNKNISEMFSLENKKRSTAYSIDEVMLKTKDIYKGYN